MSSALVAFLVVSPLSRLMPIPLVHLVTSRKAPVYCGALGHLPMPPTQLAAANGLSKAEEKKWAEAAVLLRAALQHDSSRLSAWC